MPHSCAAVDCANRSSSGCGLRFFRFPSEKHQQVWRQRWISALLRCNKDGTPWEPTPNSRVCSDHFYTGQPERLMTHPDYVPSIFWDRPARADIVQQLQLELVKQDARTSDSKENLEEVRGDVQGSANTSATSTGPSAAKLDASLALLEIPAACMASLERELAATKEQLLQSQHEVEYWKELYLRTQGRLLNLNLIREPSECQYYTGLPSFEVFEALHNALANGMPRPIKGPEPKLSHAEEFLMVLVRLRTGLPIKELARNFGMTMSHCSKTFSKWVLYMQAALKSMTRFPTLAEVQRNLPHHFKGFEDTRVVIDCTEIKIQKPSAMEAQKHTFSPYKHDNTQKVLIGATPDGYICFVSRAWGGSQSDREMVIKSDLLSLLNPGDAIMMDKGFKIFDVLPAGVKVHMPPFNRPSQGQMSAADVLKTRQIARARVHIERVIRRIKEYHILGTGCNPLTMADVVDAVVQSCAYLCNFRYKLL
ncbi:hypothetical protein HPB48_014473 [Haemaphysalis longicornis]|uniref:THAP-type domain-containing protein n=1 Tax=Haemaphysalis longicornis TaxID=44386 RepID=A0A9J6FVE2_HAELO|nr:hypothetical protein HPB48_014473 [Haemaphysalis longicornis]